MDFRPPVKKDEDRRNRALEGYGLDLMTSTALLAALSISAKKSKPLTEEQIKEREEMIFKRRINNAIDNNTCNALGCKGKLIRGKKERRNDYKRKWTCSVCGKVYIRQN